MAINEPLRGPKARTCTNSQGQVEHYFGRCECGGEVWGVADFGQWWTVCKDCSPVVKVDISKLRGKVVPHAN